MNKKLTLKKLSIVCASALVLSACSMAPKYERIETLPVAEQYPNQKDTASIGKSVVNLGWQDYFADPRLQQLISLSLENNRDLRVAALNVQAAEAQYGIQRADRIPNLGVDANGARGRTAQDLSGNGSAYTSSQYTVGLGVTAFELDLFGRVKSLSDSALQQYFATQEARDAAHISLIASVAKAYFSERTAQAGMKVSADVLASREKSYELNQLKFKHGVISAIDLRAAETQIEQARAEYASYTRNRDQARNALTLLVGGPIPADLAPELPLSQQFLVTSLPAGLPSDLLNNRPDIRQAERQLQAANANIGAARAAFFPRISLTGAIGTGSVELGNLFEGPNRTWSFLPQISIPIFQGGRLKGNLDLANIRKDIAVAQYEKSIQSAFQDVADSFSAQSTLKDQFNATARSNKAEQERYRLVRLSFNQGVSSSLELLDAERSSFASQQALLQTQLLSLNNKVDVYKSLGGGLFQDSQKSE